MRNASSILALVVLLTVPAALIRGEGDDTKQHPSKEKSSAEEEKPLLLLDDEAPLLLDDGAAGDPASGGADNSRCKVCHLNMVMEELAVIHAKQEIGCADCHGNCDEHIDDESWASGGPGTPPEIMYPPNQIDESCSECHSSHDASAQKVLMRWQQCCPEKTDASSIVCTDCHGKHRSNPKLRKAWWDKKTGRPINVKKATRTAPDTD
jgi:hypothetical protein